MSRRHGIRSGKQPGMCCFAVCALLQDLFSTDLTVLHLWPDSTENAVLCPKHALLMVTIIMQGSHLALFLCMQNNIKPHVRLAV